MLAPHRFYYLHNFQRALTWIEQRYGDLLSAAEHHFLEQFAPLPVVSQALLVRMLMRRGPWFRAAKLQYEEIGDPLEAAAPLLQMGWIDATPPLHLEELFALHTKAELLEAFALLPGHGATRKADLLETVRARGAQPRSYVQWRPGTQEAVWRVMVAELCDRFRVMFFGNLHQEWSEFVLSDLGVFRYEVVALEKSSRPFHSRADLECFLKLHACRQAVEEGADPADVLRALEECTSPSTWLEQRRAKVLLRLGQACERIQDWEHATLAYRQCRYPGARHRLMRVYERCARFSEALALVHTAMQAPESDEESQRVARMLPRLQRRLGLVTEGRRGPTRKDALSPCTHIELDPPVTPCSVEWALRDHWHSREAPVFYVENALINSLFGLLCWPAVFAPLAGAFFHPFQSGPADLGFADFVRRRAVEFDGCLASLEDGTYRRVIQQRYARKRGVQCPFVYWSVLNEDLLGLALDCIPAEHLRLLFRRMLRDIQANRTGLPDLIRFWPQQSRYEMVEVKGPGDKLQDNQIRWLEYCRDNGIPASVCHVSWRVTQPTAIESPQAVM